MIWEHAREDTFGVFVTACSATAHQLKSIAESDARQGWTRSRDRNTSKVLDRMTGRETSDDPPDKDLDARACYKCGKVGHIAKCIEGAQEDAVVRELGADPWRNLTTSKAGTATGI